MIFPLKKQVQITEDSNSFSKVNFLTNTEVPINNHVGAFGYKRKFHTHEGVDLYCNNGEPVYAMEKGIMVTIQEFTGTKVIPPSIWWEDTQAVLVEGESGVIVYGEIIAIDLKDGQIIMEGQLLGHVKSVLKKDKGRPMSMLHLELRKPGTIYADYWEETKPSSILDPTELLIKSI